MYHLSYFILDKFDGSCTICFVNLRFHVNKKINLIIIIFFKYYYLQNSVFSNKN